MLKSAITRPSPRLSVFYAATFLVIGIQLPFWPVWLTARGLSANDIGIVLGAAIWAKVIVTPAIGVLADRWGQRRAMMGALAAIALIAYVMLWPGAGFWALVLLNIVALTAQSALMPLGDAVTLAACRAHGLDYGRIRIWGSVSFILASLASGAILASIAAEGARTLVLGASAVLLIACLGVPSAPGPNGDPVRSIGARGGARETRFWIFVASASALQASHQVYYGFGTLYWHSLGFSDAIVGCLWAVGVAAEIMLFWHGRWLLALLGPIGLMVAGGTAGILRWSLAGMLTDLPSVAALQLLHALTFGASHLGAMHFLSRAVPASAAAGAQSIYAAVSSGFGGGLVMLAAGALYADYGGHAYFFMAILSALGVVGTLRLRRTLAG